MLKTSIGVLALLTLFIVGSLTAVAGEEQATMDAIWVPVGRLVIAPPVGVRPKRSAVAFPHSLHFKYSCEACHHTWDYHTVLDSCTTAGCHDLTEPPENALKDRRYTKEGIRYYTYAYHTMCRNCHRDISNQNRERIQENRFATKNMELLRNGPVGCLGCHPKE